MENELQQFINDHLAKVKPLMRDLYHLHWEYDTKGDQSLVEKKEKVEKEYLALLTNEEDYKKIKQIYDSKEVQNPSLKRQLECLYNTFAMHQGDAKYIDKIVELESKVTSSYNHYRGKIDGKSFNDNEIKKILREETDEEYRKKAWEASKQIGAEVAENVLELVRIRNQSAKESGHDDYYKMALTHKELDEEKMFSTLQKLVDLTDEPFKKLKDKLDQEKAEKYGISPDQLRPWHHADPFFQQPPPHGKLNLDRFYAEANIEKLMITTYDSIGMDIRDILDRSDLYPKEGKCQHAYCTFVDREAKDVRILCNVDQTETWTSTMLHEFGHGVYDKYIDPQLPFLLHAPAHTLSTEAIAMMMDTLSKNPLWLKNIVGARESDIDPIKSDLIDEERLAQFVFVRWGLVMVFFERELYRNPDQDLNTLWWDFVEKFQYIKRPENRNSPDWASKIHLALCPVYYQNYIYGELVSAQLQHHIRQNVGNGQLFNNPSLGEYLIKEYFEPGAQHDWNKTLEKATGNKLNPEYYVKESLGISA